MGLGNGGMEAIANSWRRECVCVCWRHWARWRNIPSLPTPILVGLSSIDKCVLAFVCCVWRRSYLPLHVHKPKLPSIVHPSCTPCVWLTIMYCTLVIIAQSRVWYDRNECGWSERESDEDSSHDFGSSRNHKQSYHSTYRHAVLYRYFDTFRVLVEVNWSVF